MLKLNVTSSKNENGDDATVSVDTGSLEGGGGGKVAAGLVVGQFLQVGLVRWGLHFPFFPGQAGGSQAAGDVGAGRLWDGAHFTQLAAPHTLSSAALIHPEGSGLSFSTPLRQ